MGIGDRFKGLFRRRALRDLLEPESRRAIVKQACQEALLEYKHDPANPARWRNPLLTVATAMEEVGLDSTEIYRAADQVLPNDAFWLEKLVERLLTEPHLEPRHIIYLHREAERQSSNVTLWRRLLEERKRQRDEVLYTQTREALVLHLSQYFPAKDKADWANVSTETEARALFFRNLDEALDAILRGGRADPQAEKVLLLGHKHYPQRGDILLTLARLICDLRQDTSESLGFVLEALMIDPYDVRLKTYAGQMLMRRRGHEDEGLELLRQAHEMRPEDAEITEALVHGLCRRRSLTDEDFKLVRAWFRDHPESTTVADALAECFASRSDVTTEALKAYECAARTGTGRSRYLRLIGKAHAKQSNWDTVIELFEDVHHGGDESEDVVVPLATAHAEIGHNDQNAITLYRKAIELGSRHPKIHNEYARYLYQKDPDAPEAVRQFRESAECCPDSLWARLGVVRAQVSSENYMPALEEASELLVQNPNDQEMQTLAAEALAGDSRRSQIRRVIALPPRTAYEVLRKARDVQPDAFNITKALARQCLSLGIRDEETEKMLGEICRRDPDDLELKTARADLLYEKEDFDTALDIYRQVLARSRAGTGAPPTTRVLLKPELRSQILFRMAEHLIKPPGPKPDDLEILLEAATDANAPADFVLRVAREMIDVRQDHPLRMAFLERALAIAPDDADLEREVARSRARKGNPRSALRIALKNLESGDYDPANVSLLSVALQCAQREHINDEAGERLLSIASRHSEIPDPAALVLGRTIAMGGLVRPELVPILEKSLEIEPENPNLVAILAQSYETGGNHQKAAETYLHLVDLQPEDSASVVGLARSQARLGRTGPEYLKLAREAFRVAPQDPEIALHFSRTLLNSGQEEEAIQVLTSRVGRSTDFDSQVLQLVEGNGLALDEHPGKQLLFAKAYISVGRLEDALGQLAGLHPHYTRFMPDLMDCYGEILDQDRTNFRAIMERGILLKVAGRLEESLEDLRDAAQLAPDNESVQEEYLEALEQLTNSSSRVRAERWVELARCYMEMGRLEDIERAVEGALARDPDNGEALLLQARNRAQIGDLDRAKENLERLPDSPEKSELMREIADKFRSSDNLVGAAEVLAEMDEDLELSEIEELARLQVPALSTAPDESDLESTNEAIRFLAPSAQTRYQLQRKLGEGITGEVYIAYDKELDELVALHLLSPELSRDESTIDRVREQVRRARRLSHPNIVRINEFSQEGERTHISTEFVAGGDLGTFVRQESQGLEEFEAVDIVRQVARALVHAHSEGTLHGDVKPSNILLAERGRVKLSDFGLGSLLVAQILELDAVGEARTLAAPFVGSPFYMSPEQLSGQEIDERSDIYSLGVVLHYILTGRPPFERGSIAYHHQFTAPPPLPDGTSPLIRGVVDKCLAKIPEDRFASAIELLQALDGFDGNRRVRSG